MASPLSKLPSKWSVPCPFLPNHHSFHFKSPNPAKSTFTIFAIQNQDTQNAVQETTLTRTSNPEDDESYGEVNRIIGSRAVEGGKGMQYLIEWKDGHDPSWVPSDFIAKHVVAEVQELLEKRGKGDQLEYLVKWKDGGDNEWVNAALIGEDLVRDYEAGLEYAVAEGVIGKRMGDDGKNEYLVK